VATRTHMSGGGDNNRRKTRIKEGGKSKLVSK
jgi:hypothetical protein